MESDHHIILDDSKPLLEEDILNIIYKYVTIEISDASKQKIKKAEECVQKQVKDGKIVYGVTTGLGSNATKTISIEDAAQLQENLLLSHACGV